MRPYYTAPGITIWHADARDVDVDADCFVTDPPYGVKLKAKVYRRPDGGGSIEIPAEYDSFDDTPEYVGEVIVPIVSECVDRYPRGAVTPGIRNLWLYPPPRDLGVIWAPAGSGRGPWGFTCAHPIAYYGKCPYLANGRGGRPNGTTWNSRTEKNGHPCPKPIQVMRWLVNRVAGPVPGQTVYDPFMGSGTTLVAALETGHQAVGVDISEKYCEIAAARIETAIAAGADVMAA